MIKFIVSWIVITITNIECPEFEKQVNHFYNNSSTSSAVFCFYTDTARYEFTYYRYDSAFKFYEELIKKQVSHNYVFQGNRIDSVKFMVKPTGQPRNFLFINE